MSGTTNKPDPKPLRQPFPVYTDVTEEELLQLVRRVASDRLHKARACRRRRACDWAVHLEETWLTRRRMNLNPPDWPVQQGPDERGGR